MTHRPGHYRVGIDIGGTFTDLVMVDETSGAFVIEKTLTTPLDPSQAVETALSEALRQTGSSSSHIQQVIHGTTLVTNAIIERKGDRSALLTTQGFRDSVEIGRESRYDLYNLLIDLPQPLIPRYLRFDVPQRTLADGTTLDALDIAYVERLAHELAESGIEAVAIVFLHSFANPAAEEAAREAVRRAAPSLRVSISSEVIPEMREFDRASTTIANVYVQGRVERYLRRLQTRLQQPGFQGTFLMMLSSGGTATVETAMRFPIRLLESGPAAGALAAADYGSRCGRPDLLSFDMGGTTAKFCVVASCQPLVTHEFEVDRVYRFTKGSGLPINVPVVEMIEIGAGGGSIARLDSLGLIKVGPDSAGAEPGPVSYGRGGTEPTITDADLVLGYLDPEYFLGGQMTLDLTAARRAIKEHIAEKLGIAVEEAAWGIHQIVNESMANAARVHILERGKDVHRLPIFAYGGAGPVHAFRIAQALGVPEIIVPFGAGVTSAFGFLSAPLAFDFVRSWVVQLDGLDWTHANQLLTEMEAEGTALLTSSGIADDQLTYLRAADMRYVGQGYEVSVPLPLGQLDITSTPRLVASFEDVYRQRYGRLGPSVPIEVVNWRVISSGPKPASHLERNNVRTKTGGTAQKGTRLAFFPELDGYCKTPIYDRYQLSVGATFVGPAIVEERESTTVIGPNARGTIDEHANLVVILDGAFHQ